MFWAYMEVWTMNTLPDWDKVNIENVSQLKKAIFVEKEEEVEMAYTLKIYESVLSLDRLLE